MNISPDFKGSTRQDRKTLKEIMKREATPGAFRHFVKHSNKLSDYCYWFALGTLWVSYTGYSDLNLWRRCFSAPRPRRSSSLMKPDELRLYHALPPVIVAYRAHRDGETDWISYTLSPSIAARFAREREVATFSQYAIQKTDVPALFTRRGEQEVLVLDPGKARLIQTIDIDPAGGN